jgi:hypothetical protein
MYLGLPLDTLVAKLFIFAYEMATAADYNPDWLVRS